MTVPVDYSKLLPSIRRSCHRRDRLGGERGIEQIANRPDPIRNAKRHCWRAAQAFMHAAEDARREYQDVRPLKIDLNN